ncbi:hypothetical protein [Clostridium manihotivorum]|uniref:YncE family protein n=1 Tax=Clostridium manihotivorum TaxID=2320868 RepID=A0A3R5UA98_9CLOT|nr:hypothetical protein [Clostridium manihotivorum]QAA33446.1 hypothetical protein C1I91_18335 [Clostridium manihotivorum]
MLKSKKLICDIAVILILFFSGLYFYINYNKNRFISQSKLPYIHIGVIQSTQNQNIGYVSFYDKNLNLLEEKQLPFGDMGDQTRVPLLSNTSFYSVPLGLGNQKDLKTIIKFDLNTGKYKTIKINQPAILMYTVNKDDVYTTNTINFVGYITKCDTKTGQLQEWKKNGLVIASLKCYDDILYAWGTISENNINTPYLLIFDSKNLKLLKQIPLNQCGTQQLDSCKIGDDIYFTNNLDINGNEGSKTLSKYNTKTEKIDNIELGEIDPNQILLYKDKLYITHCNPLAANLNKITIFDPKTQDQKLVEMENALVQTIRYNNYLYSQDINKLYVYNIDNMNLIKSITINKPRPSSPQSRFYIGGFFVKQ